MRLAFDRQPGSLRVSTMGESGNRFPQRYKTVLVVVGALVATAMVARWKRRRSQNQSQPPPPAGNPVSDMSSPNPSSPEPAPTQPTEVEQRATRLEKHAKIAPFFSAVAATGSCITAVVALFTSCQSVKTSRLNYEMVKELNKEIYRPYVGCSLVRTTDSAAATDFVTIEVRYKNYGNVPAHNVKVTPTYMLGAEPLRFVWKTNAAAVIFPGASMISKCDITKTEFQSVRSGQQKLTLSFKIEYQSFSGAHLTSFSYEYSPRRNEFAPLEEIVE